MLEHHSDILTLHSFCHYSFYQKWHTIVASPNEIQFVYVYVYIHISVGRLFSYSDTHRHRLGPNYLQIPVNCPYSARISNYQRDGFMTVTANQSGAPNYYPNSFSGPEADPKVCLSSIKVPLPPLPLSLNVSLPCVPLDNCPRCVAIQHRQRGQLYPGGYLLPTGADPRRETETSGEHSRTHQERGSLYPEESGL